MTAGVCGGCGKLKKLDQDGRVIGHYYAITVSRSAVHWSAPAGSDASVRAAARRGGSSDDALDLAGQLLPTRSRIASAASNIASR